MIVVAGEALIDRIVRPDGSVVELPGGGPVNAARTIARLGIRAGFLGCLSSDRLGAVLRDALAADGVDLSMIAATDAPTTVAIAQVGDRGDVTYRFEVAGTSAPQLDAATVRAALGRRPAALHVGTLGLVLEPMATTLANALVEADPETLVLVDPNCRPSVIPDRDVYLARLMNVLRRANVVKASRDDVVWLWPALSPQEAARRILDLGPQAVLITDGPRPVLCATPRFTFELAVARVAPVDTIGAGDAFGGAFLGRWIERGLDRDALADEPALRDAVALASEVAGLTCLRAGADPPHRRELGWPPA